MMKDETIFRAYGKACEKYSELFTVQLVGYISGSGNGLIAERTAKKKRQKEKFARFINSRLSYLEHIEKSICDYQHGEI